MSAVRSISRYALLAVLLALAYAWAQPLPYQDPAQPIAARVADLLGRMTLAEKVGQMTQVNVTRLMGRGEWDRGPLSEYWLERILVDNHVGSLLSGGGAAPVPNHPAAWAEFTNTLQRYALDTRLGIPLIYGTDAVHGHNNVVGATIYPHNIGLAAAWDPTLVEEIAVRTARDVRATGIHWNFAPVADLGRDPRWGRFYETFGEDPLLASELVAASVRGLQAEGQIAATVKHFVGYGQAITGMDRAPAFIPPRTLRDTHLPPFEAGIRAGALTVMANSGSVNAVPVHASRYLLTEVLRGELGFAGVVVSDWNDIEKLVTVHRVAATFADAVAMSINAGVDMYMVPHDADRFTRTLIELVEDGVVTQARIDEAVTRILTLKMTLGLFEDPFTTAAEAADIIEVDRSLARRAAAASVTLLENDGTLPLKSPATILVMGPGADDLAMQMGGWTIGWQGIESRAEMPPGVTVVQGLQAAAAEGVTVKHLHDTRDAAAVRTAADDADVVVVVLGEAPYAEGYGDSTSLALPAEQLTLARTAAASGTPVVVVLFAGRPLVFPEDFWQAANAVVMAYLPGSEGGTAVADVLYGNYNPAGRLPFTWPRSVGQLPLTYDALPGPQTPEPLFPFGHGLSYTRFTLGRVEAELTSGAITLHFEVANTGEHAGSQVVPVFLQRPPLPVMVPGRQLVGFTRVTLEPGERQRLTIHIPLTRLSVVLGDALGDAAPTVLPGVYTLHVEGAQVRVTIP